MAAEVYLDATEQALRRLRETQAENIEAAAKLFSDTLAAGRAIFAFGASHSFAVAAELVYRTGGLVPINPIYPHGMDFSVRPLTQTSQTERLAGLGRLLLESSAAQTGDVLLLASVSGRNAVVIDMALAALEHGLHLVGVTSTEYSRAVASRHPSGKRLMDICEVVIDHCAPLGDAAVEVPGEPQRTGPLSTVLSCAAVNAVVAQTVANLVERGVRPPIFMSANLDGGDGRNAELLREHADRVFYM